MAQRTVRAVASRATVGGEAVGGDATAPDHHRNEVVIVGRVSGEPETRELPSGDEMVCWRVVVSRPTPRPVVEGSRAPTVDTLDCVAWSAGLRRTAGRLVVGDVVEVQGALRRRFWRAGAGVQSRYEIEAAAVRRVQRAG